MKENPYASPLNRSRKSSDQNTSGKGGKHPIPSGVYGWSWGAFSFGALWSLCNGVDSKHLLGLMIPFYNFYYLFVFSKHGRIWAWQNKKWESVEVFQKIQRRWNIAGIICLLSPIIVLLLAFVVAILSVISGELYDYFRK